MPVTLKVTRQTLDALKQLEQRMAKTEVTGQGSASIVVYSSEHAALMAAIVALS